LVVLVKEWRADPGSSLAALRIEVHRLLDARWVFGTETRDESYRWLAQEMKIPLSDCHVKMFDAGQCERAIAVLRNERTEP
jgi:hypothetical protein